MPVKKQRKYNLARWAVTGRDNLAINAACQRIYRGHAGKQRARLERALLSLGQRFSHPSDRETLDSLLRALAGGGSKMERAAARAARRRMAMPSTDRYFTIETPTVSATLDRRRGLALASLQFAGQTTRRPWAACRMAFSTTSRWRPTGTPAIACSRRRANTS